MAKDKPHLVDDATVSFTRGWVTLFRERHDVKFVKLHGEAASAPQEEVARAKEMIEDLVRRYHPSRIYNMEKAGLSWQMEPDKSLVTNKEGEVRGTKKQKARITLAVCANLTGRDKVKL